MEEAVYLYVQTKDWVIEAGQKIRDYLQFGKMRYETKSRLNDLVTEMDREVERMLAEKITAANPDHRVLGEEGIAGRPERLDGAVWLIDPIDGTSNFVTQQCNFVISVGLYENGQGVLGIVYDVMRDEMIHTLRGHGVFVNDKRCQPLGTELSLMDALVSMEFVFHDPDWETQGIRLLQLGKRVRGVRVYGATALAMAKVATGKNGAFLTVATNPWDYGAGKILVEEAGGMVTDFAGKDLPWGKRSSVIACHPAIHRELLQFMEGDE